ncbi:MAG: energy-coupling factor transporter transmembrane protein EcfT [Ruminococcaceae bacterium]|nr:energy-coupling factor transporter transmembrane protein EcfT [Oscillospiraceae bacterium]
MISDITLGQFFPGTSPIHRLDPRTKILLTTLFIVAVFLANSAVGFAALLLGVLLLIACSKISFRVILRGIKPVIYVLIFTALINVFVTKGEGEPLLSFYIIKIYKEGIIRAVFMALRVILLITGTSVLLTYTTSPISLTDGIESLFSPLKRIGIPVHVFAMMMTIALRFIPTLVEETEKIMNAQKSRGADFSSGSLVKRAKALIPILLPLFISSFNRADELATAMECRCYRGDKNRTKLVKLQYRGIDALWMLIGLIFLGSMIALKVLRGDIADLGGIYGIFFYKI